MITLPQGYYRVNFIELTLHVYALYADLLSRSELDFYQQFHRAGESAQNQYVRMITRKGNFFVLDKLVYDEIPNAKAAADELAECGLVVLNPNLAIDQLLGLFSKPEWLKILAEQQVDTKKLKGLKRVAFDEAIIELAERKAVDETMISQSIIQLVNPECFDTFKLLFFGNLEQDLTEFVLRDLGLYRFEQYAIDKTVRQFNERATIQRYLDYYQQLESLEAVLTLEAQAIVNFHKKLPIASDQDKTLNRRIQRVNLTLARQLERLDALTQALLIYQVCQLPPARERSARILVKQNKIESALAMCQDMKRAPLCDEESIIGAEFGYRTAKKHNLSWPVPDKYKPPSETIQLQQSGQGVEVDVAQHFSRLGDCFFVENALFCSLFGLHYWPLLFAQVKGAFTHPFQVRPHDLYDADFVINRQTAFDKAQAQVANINQNSAYYLDLWQQKFGIATPFVYWDTVDEALLTKALSRIPAKHWQLIFDRLWADLRTNRSGFPDLILFPEAGGYELIEVKGPGDKLQKNQLRWMQFFDLHGINHRVVHVTWV